METRQAQRRRWGRSEEQRLAWLRKALRRPGAKLVLEHLGMHGHRFAIVPGGLRVTDEEAAVLVRRGYIREHDRGLFNDAPQSWTCD